MAPSQFFINSCDFYSRLVGGVSQCFLNLPVLENTDDQIFPMEILIQRVWGGTQALMF